MAIDNVDTVLREVALLVIGNGFEGVYDPLSMNCPTVRSSKYDK